MGEHVTPAHTHMPTHVRTHTHPQKKKDKSHGSDNDKKINNNLLRASLLAFGVLDPQSASAIEQVKVWGIGEKLLCVVLTLVRLL